MFLTQSKLGRSDLPWLMGSYPEFLFPQPGGPPRSVSPAAETCGELLGFRPLPQLPLCQVAMLGDTAHVLVFPACQVP